MNASPQIEGGLVEGFERGINSCGGDPVITGVKVRDTEYGIACNESGFPTFILSTCDTSSPTVTGNTITRSQVGLFTGSLCDAYIGGNVVDSNRVGLRSDNSASVVSGNKIMLNDSVGVYCSGSSLPILGDLSNADSTDDGYNDIWDNADFEVVNETTDTVQAENNYWGPYPSPDSSQFSGLVDYEPALEIVPMAVTDFYADLVKVPSKNGLLLQWSAVTEDVEGHPEQVDHYTIYRDTIPYFEASSEKILTQLPDTVLEYFDSGVVGDESVNYYYLVTAVDYGANQSADSDQIGEFDRTITELKGAKSPDGFNLVSWPLIPFDTDIQAIFADSLGTGCQLTGGNLAVNSDKVRYKDTSNTWYMAWYKVSGSGSSWQGSLAEVEGDKGYWVIIRTGHPGVTLTMPGRVNTDTCFIPIAPGPGETHVGNSWLLSRPLSGSTGDDCGLLASGFTGGVVGVLSDKVRHFDGVAWCTAWYQTAGTPTWRGELSSGQGTGDPELEPGNGYVIQVLDGHAFDDNQWVYPPPVSSKGAVGAVSRPKREGGHQVSPPRPRAPGPSTNRSLDPKREVGVRRKR
jgi:hypothetical protein